MEKREIIYVSASASGYGGENSLFMLAGNLPEGFEPLVITPEEGPLTEKLDKAGIKRKTFPYAVLQKKYFHPLGIMRYQFFWAVSAARFLSLFIRLKPDIVHTNTSQVMAAAFAAKILGIPHMWHIREIPGISPVLWNIWKWYILAFSTRVVCISNAVKKQFGRSRKTEVILNGIDISAFPFTPTLILPPQGGGEARGRREAENTPQGGGEERGEEEEVKRAGMVGRINYWKGQELFIEAANLVLKVRKDVRFFIAGDARAEYKKLEEDLHRKAEEYGISENVVFTGFLPREKVAELLNSLDIFLLTSIQPEPFGLVVIEAMACGKAVIAPSEGGPPDIIENGVSGMLVEPRNPEAYAEALLHLLADSKMRREMGIRARRRVEEKFTIERTVSEIVSLYEKASG